MGRTGGQILVDALDAFGVDTVFGIPGIHTLPIYDALFEHPRIHHVVTRHEQGAGYMADGYARVTGGVGVVLTTTGPAAVNALTPVGEANAESSPVLLIASGPDDDMTPDSGYLHEMRDQFQTLMSVTGQGKRATSGQEIVAGIEEAMSFPGQKRPRPYVLELPIGVIKTEYDADPPSTETFPPTVPAENELRRAVDMLNVAERPFLFVGGGAQGASREVAQLAEGLRARVGASGNGLGVVPVDDPCYVGTNAAPDWWINRADVIVAVGTRFDARTQRWIGTPDAKVIHVDLDPGVIGRTLQADVALVGDASATLTILNNQLDRQVSSSWSERKQAPDDPVDEQACSILKVLRQAMCRDAVLFNDMTLVCYQARRFFDVYEPRTFHSPITYGSLGFSVPAAIGAKLADRDRQVVALCGDGGFMFTAQEVLTAKQERVGLPVVLFNDNCYSAIKRAQDWECEGRNVAVTLENPDFQLFAESFGIPSARVTASPDLGEEVRVALGREIPTLIEVDLGRFRI
ncbi:MAG: thiamine pyrophosphate-binding protein [Candidatus Latescibacterota bacterium]|nr:thiamine pyrophosphate-binding protein [Candidatus Latescibacterota bacterium]